MVEFRKMVTVTLYARWQRHRYKVQAFGLWEKARMG